MADMSIHITAVCTKITEKENENRKHVTQEF